MKLHVILASDQVLQNLIPVLMERPQRVCLVVTTALACRGADQRLRRLLRQADAELIRCTDAPDAGFADIRAYAHQVVEQVITAGADAEIVLNATGGTKLMAIAYVEAFRGIAQRILYTDTAHRRIGYLPSERDAAVPTPTPMTNVLDVLACHLNQLLFIEFKTLRLHAENDNAIAYKLDSLGEDARGLFGSTWLLSARQPTDTLIARARHARIRLIGPDQLQDLRGLVREWRV